MSKALESRTLTDQQAAFVRAYCRAGGDGTKAAIEAGYSRESAASRSYELRQKPHVQAAIQAELRKSFTDLATIALDQAKQMLLDPKTPASARVDLIKTTLDRAGLGAPKIGEGEGNEDRPLRYMTLAQLEAMAVRALSRSAGPAPADPVPVDAVVEGMKPVSLLADDEAAPE